MLRAERAARLFFLAHAQSSFGTGVGYVALVLIAYERHPGPWGITLVLLADFLPAIALGPLFGAAADRWSRRRCAVLADGLRAVAFTSVAFVGGLPATLAFALLAGTGSGLFTPAALAGLQRLVPPDRLPAATSLYGALADLGHTAGPAMAAGVLLLASPEALLVLNGATFGISALLLARVPLGERAGRAPGRSAARGSLLSEARDGLRATAGLPVARAVILASAAVVLFAGMLNVGELLLVTEELGAGEAAFSWLVAVLGAGVVAGSLLGARGGDLRALRRRYLAGLLLVAAGLVAAGAAPALAAAMAAFAATGVGNGLIVVHERLILQRVVPDALMGRTFGVSDALGSWAFAAAFLAAGAVAALVGTRPLFLLAGTGAAGVWLALVLAWRKAAPVQLEPGPARTHPAAVPPVRARVGEEGLAATAAVGRWPEPTASRES